MLARRRAAARHDWATTRSSPAQRAAAARRRRRVGRRCSAAGTWTAESYARGPGRRAGHRAAAAAGHRAGRALTSARTPQQADYVDLDTGLAAIAAHAKGLGYDAVVLFLDELVLWLAFSVQDREFFGRESQKLTKLVESGAGDRRDPAGLVRRPADGPAPLVRRRRAPAAPSRRRWTGRSGTRRAGSRTIVLGDDNLPYVANQRLLRRRSDDRRPTQVLDDAFARLDRRPEVWDVLLDGVNTDERHRGADEAAFRLTYPFSPALVSTLRILASVMQRERTALKVMQQMLVDRRDTLTVDDVIPVGDSFDYIVAGPASRWTRRRPRCSGRPPRCTGTSCGRSCWRARAHRGRRRRRTRTGCRAAFRADDRLAKTLLLSAVAPNVPALKELTAARLASLNHGSIVSPLPGSEAGVVLAKVREWARKVPEIHVGGDAAQPGDPGAALRRRLRVGRGAAPRARTTTGRRRELLKDLVPRGARDRPSATRTSSASTRHPMIWRGSRREVDVVFGNVRDAGWLTEDHFRARPGTWRFVIDYPFDEPGHSAAEDLAPGRPAVAEGGLTVADDRVAAAVPLRGADARRAAAGHPGLAAQRHRRPLDRARRPPVRGRPGAGPGDPGEPARRRCGSALRRAMQEAYGAAAPTAGRRCWTTPRTTGCWSAWTRLLARRAGRRRPRPPRSATWSTRRSRATYPGHPRFEPGDVEVTVRDLAAVYAHVERAVADPDGRVRLEGDIAAVRRVANPLRVGTAGETHFLFGDDRFARGARSSSGPRPGPAPQPQDPVTVGRSAAGSTAMRPELGLRDEVGRPGRAGLGRAAAAGLVPARRADPGAPAGHDPPGHGTAARAAARSRRLGGRDVARRGRCSGSGSTRT